ncbi:hypothetical protein MtrunA17_Chr5g0430591 [Medicago truncatula]|uniref:Transmembrane protein n=1 Tax=Medicago truncatula TaxID=3880 RepID=A0A396HVL4_MEDTR|nr:hypothetical protein MtrunA17_Chr5g0430591 [Medicago truncatula]
MPTISILYSLFSLFDGLIACLLPSFEINFSGQNTFSPLPVCMTKIHSIPL